MCVGQKRNKSEDLARELNQNSIQYLGKRNGNTIHDISKKRMRRSKSIVQHYHVNHINKDNDRISVLE